MIVLVGGLKGGSGKSLLAAHLAVLRSQAGRKVLLVDTDKQQTLTDWWHIRQRNKIPTNWTSVKYTTDEEIKSEIPRFKKDYDDIIIDSGGFDSEPQRASLFLAHQYILPFQPSSADIWTIKPLSEILKKTLDYNPKLQTKIIINRADVSGTDNDDSKKIFESFGIPQTLIIPHFIVQRKIFKTAFSEGKAVHEHKTKDKKAIDEIKILYDYIYQNDIKNMP